MLGDTDAALRTCGRVWPWSPKTPSCGFARASHTSAAVSRTRRKRPGGGFSRCAGPQFSPAWTRVSTGTSPGATWRRWRRNEGISRKPAGSGGPFWPSARVTGMRSHISVRRLRSLRTRPCTTSRLRRAQSPRMVRNSGPYGSDRIFPLPGAVRGIGAAGTALSARVAGVVFRRAGGSRSLM